jgi:predicted double-glycine peptidase
MRKVQENESIGSMVMKVSKNQTNTVLLNDEELRNIKGGSETPPSCLDSGSSSTSTCVPD